jgi:hypothetical protein
VLKKKKGEENKRHTQKYIEMRQITIKAKIINLLISATQ